MIFALIMADTGIPHELHCGGCSDSSSNNGSSLAPAAEQIKSADTLCIVPDGFLWNLPFQALMPANDRFLLEDHAIYYAPSFSVLGEMARKEPGGRSANSLVAFGNPVIGKDEQHKVDLCPLPEAENEVGSIAKT